jgi:outer membrane biosynthesis protein TonB
MPLSDDQRAMLRLLAQREQGYDDLAALMGLSVDEVRAKVVEALAQLEAEGEPTPTLPSERAAAAEAEVAEAKAESGAEAPPPEAPEPPQEPAATPEGPPAEPAGPQTPAAVEPPPPSAPEPPAKPAPQAAAPAAKRTPPPRPKLSLPGSGGARAAIAAGATVLVLLVVILVVGGGDDSGESDGGSGDTTAVEEGTNTNTASNNPDITQALLQATDGSDAEGVASFGRVKNSLALQIEASGLEPSGKGESYTVWLAQTPEKMLPLATTTVGEEGKIGAQSEVPTEVLGYLANETFTKIVVTRTGNAALQASLKKATAAKQAPEYTGTEVLNGTVTGPIVGAAKKEESGE